MQKLLPEAEMFRLDTILEHLRTPLFRNGYALIISTGITSLLGLLYWTIAARVYETDNVGLNSTAISAMIFLSGIAQFNLQETMIRFIPQAGTHTLRLVVTTYGIVIALSVAAGLVFCLGISIWAPALSFLTESLTSVIWFVCALVLWGIFVIQDSVLIGLRQALWIPFENAIFSISKIVLLLLLAASFPQDGIFISWTIAVAAIILPINYLIFRRLIPRYSAQAHAPSMELSVRHLSKYVASNYVAALLSNMSSALLPILIVQLLGPTANAHFYLAWIVASALQIVIANMATSMTVEGAMNQAALDEHKHHATIGIARLVIPMAALLIIFAPQILQVMGPSYAQQATILMQLLALSALPNIYNMLYVGLARIQNRMRGVVGVYGANAVMVLGLSILFMPNYGITGVGLAWVISQTTIAAVVFLLPRLRQYRTLNLEKGYRI
jgi:O-antigen/teichoic acid export membrane protein